MTTTVLIKEWRQIRKHYRRIPRSIYVSLQSYVEENRPYTLTVIARALRLPVEDVAYYCRVMRIRTYFSQCEQEQVICGWL